LRRRESIGRSLRDVVERLEERQDVAARAAEEQITRRAKERLDAAIADFEARAERALAEGRRELAATERRIAGAVETAVRAADWESRLVAAVQVEEGVARRIAEAERRLLRAINEPRPPAAPAN
jgi:hypothetical protein